MRKSKVNKVEIDVTSNVCIIRSKDRTSKVEPFKIPKVCEFLHLHDIFVDPWLIEEINNSKVGSITVSTCFFPNKVLKSLSTPTLKHLRILECGGIDLRGSHLPELRDLAINSATDKEAEVNLDTASFPLLDTLTCTWCTLGTLALDIPLTGIYLYDCTGDLTLTEDALKVTEMYLDSRNLTLNVAHNLDELTEAQLATQQQLNSLLPHATCELSTLCIETMQDIEVDITTLPNLSILNTRSHGDIEVCIPETNTLTKLDINVSGNLTIDGKGELAKVTRISTSETLKVITPLDLSNCTELKTSAKEIRGQLFASKDPEELEELILFNVAGPAVVLPRWNASSLLDLYLSGNIGNPHMMIDYPNLVNLFIRSPLVTEVAVACTPSLVTLATNAVRKITLKKDITLRLIVTSDASPTIIRV